MKHFEWHSITVDSEAVEYETSNQRYFIRLDHVDGAEVTFVDHKLFIVGGCFSLLGLFPEQTRIIAAFAAILFFGLYFATRKLTLQIHGGNVQIKRIISGKDLSEAETFIQNLKLVILKSKSNLFPFKKEA